MVSAETAASSEEPLECHLLELPAELRNRIYEFTLHEDKIQVTSQGYPRPSLMSTCRQIRQDSWKIFYHETVFSIACPDYDSDVDFAWTNHLDKVNISHMDVNSSVRHGPGPQPNWPNLLLWLRRKHADRRIRDLRMPSKMREVGIVKTESLVLGGMCQILSIMRDQPWSKVEEIILEQRPILESLDPR